MKKRILIIEGSVSGKSGAKGSINVYREFIENNILIIAFLDIISIFSAILGYFTSSWIVATLWVILDITSFILGFKAQTKIREIR